jgi:RNA polymerase I-specific transcription initiation factor RRN3
MRTHALLSSIIRLIPSGLALLPRLLSEAFPYKSKPKAVLEAYIRNALILSRYAPGLQDYIIALVIGMLCHFAYTKDRMLQIDVSIQPAEEDEEDSASLVTSSSFGNDPQQKIDLLMALMFKHINNANSMDLLIPLHDSLISAFRVSVLSTHRSRFVQFIYFHLISLSPSFWYVHLGLISVMNSWDCL